MDSRKISADIYIDDKQLGGLPEDWNEIDRMVREHPKYNEHDTRKAHRINGAL
jgi:hypothetical protein